MGLVGDLQCESVGQTHIHHIIFLQSQNATDILKKILCTNNHRDNLADFVKMLDELNSIALLVF